MFSRLCGCRFCCPGQYNSVSYSDKAETVESPANGSLLMLVNCLRKRVWGEGKTEVEEDERMCEW